MLDENRCVQRATEDSRSTHAIEDDCGEAVSALWRTMFVGAGIELPKTTGDAVEQVVMALKDRQQELTELEELRGCRHRWDSE